MIFLRILTRYSHVPFRVGCPSNPPITTEDKLSREQKREGEREKAETALTDPMHDAEWFR